MFRYFAGVAVAASLVVLASSGPVEAKQKKAKNFKIRSTANLVVLDSDASSLNQERVVKPGDVVLTAPIGVENAAFTAAEVSFEIAGYPATIGKDTLLRKSRVTGGELADYGKDARIYCNDPVKIEEKHRQRRLVDGKPTGRSRLDAQSTICLIDTDANDSFDRALLVGLNWKEDRHTVEIPETGYEMLINDPIPFSRLTIRYAKGGWLQGPILEPDALLLGRPVNPDGVYLNRPDRDGQKLYDARKVKRRDYPFELQFGDAIINLMKYDSENRDLTVKIDKGFKLSPMSFYFEPQVIYVYY